MFQIKKDFFIILKIKYKTKKNINQNESINNNYIFFKREMFVEVPAGNENWTDKKKQVPITLTVFHFLIDFGNNTAITIIIII